MPSSRFHGVCVLLCINSLCDSPACATHHAPCPNHVLALGSLLGTQQALVGITLITHSNTQSVPLLPTAAQHPWTRHGNQAKIRPTSCLATQGPLTCANRIRFETGDWHTRYQLGKKPCKVEQMGTDGWNDPARHIYTSLHHRAQQRENCLGSKDIPGDLDRPSKREGFWAFGSNTNLVKWCDC